MHGISEEHLWDGKESNISAGKERGKRKTDGKKKRHLNKGRMDGYIF
jgi:hypothetical protein